MRVVPRIWHRFLLQGKHMRSILESEVLAVCGGVLPVGGVLARDCAIGATLGVVNGIGSNSSLSSTAAQGALGCISGVHTSIAVATRSVMSAVNAAGAAFAGGVAGAAGATTGSTPSNEHSSTVGMSV
jgi:hypothetical protein